MDQKASEIEYTPYSQYAAPNLLERLKNNVFVPIGIAMTVGSYAVGLKCLATGQRALGRRMMYSRVLFQGITFTAMAYDSYRCTGARARGRRNDCPNDDIS